MSASDIQVVTIVVPNPEFDNSKSAKIINSELGYALRITNGFQTLSNNNPNNYDTIEGLLYVPNLPPNANATCSDALNAIPANATTLDDFPLNQDYPLVAIFPWTTSVECTEAFLSQARADAVRSAVSFHPNRADVPDSSDSSWSLDDAGHWKSDNQFPIYAVASSIAFELLQTMTLYSGNMSQAPNGGVLVEQYDSRDFPRLFAHVDLQGGTNVPSLWIFLIIVLAVLLGIVIIASVVMHIIQRHQRHVLQRRLERGEVDLETLGIKKMNVPQQKIDEMPKYLFISGVEAPPPIIPASKSDPRASIVPQGASFSQSTCPICLDDFIENETEVRELPCKHIFHPECIDIFLRDNSSLCPMCKKSALPPGYCPVKVTNLMVRRERLVRRMRERRRHNQMAAAARAAGDPVPTLPTRASRATTWIRSRMHGPSIPAPHRPEAGGGSDQTPPNRTQSAANDVEMGQVPAATLVNTTDLPTQRDSTLFNARRQTIAVPAEIASQGAAARRAWRRERLAQQQAEQYNAQAETTRVADEGRPLWRRIVGRVAPGFD